MVKIKILNYGSCNIDYVYALDHILKVGETLVADKLNVFPGGKGLNQSIAIARAGADVCHAGCVGTDGDFLLELMSDAGVDISFVKRTNGKNGHAVIQVSQEGENSIFIYAGSNGMIEQADVDMVLSNFSEGDILLLQNEINNIDYIIEKAHSVGMDIILNPSPINENILKLDFNMISYIILNEIEAGDISGCGDPYDSLDFFKKEYPALKVMLTLGKNGCIYQERDTRISHPIFETVAVDTTAAGDTFTGYFIAGLAAGLDTAEILRLASCAAAISVSRHGAAPSIPTRDEVLNLIKNMSVKKSGIREENTVRKIEFYIKNNIKNASLGGLADLLCYSAVYSGNVVKKLMGMSFNELLQKKRLELAASLLIETDEPIGDIISKVGYENGSYFRRIFKERYGVNPFEYRKMR